MYTKDNLTLKNDILFQEIFSKKGNEKFMESFLRALLNDKKIKRVKVEKQVTLPRSGINEKIGILDLKVLVDDNKIINIEMQRERDNYIIQRATYYSSKIFANELNKNEEYSKLKQVIEIIFLNYNIFPYDEYITESKFVAKYHEEFELNCFQKYFFIELPKFRKQKINVKDPLQAWLLFINGEHKEEVKMAMKNHLEIREAAEELEYLVADENTRKIAELKERGIRDYYSGIKSSYEEGLTKGKIIGINGIIKKMLSEKMDIKKIASITGMSKKEILKLAAK